MKKVDSKHSDYSHHYPQWKKCRLIAEGSETVKLETTKFLPSLSGQKDDDYNDYIKRALFFEGTTRTITGLQGLLFSKEPTIKEPERNNILLNLLAGYSSVKSFLKKITKEVITVGRCCLLVDVNEVGDPYITIYTAEDVINWRVERVNGELLVTLVVLCEMVDVHNVFDTKTEKRYRVLSLVDGFYQQDVYTKDKDTDEFTLLQGYPINPTKNGRGLDRIPFFFINENGMLTDVSRPPLSGLVNVNISHYMNSADLEHGRHFTGLPTAWVAGFKSEEGGKLKVGSRTAWISSKSDARAGYLEFTGQGLSSLENALKEKQDMMIVLGARLLEAPKAASESADNQKNRKHGENSILVNISDSVSDAVTEAVRFGAEWAAGNPDDYSISLCRDFITLDASPQLLLALMQQVQGGLMSFDSYFYNLKKAGMYPDGETSATELDKIDVTDPTLTGADTDSVNSQS